MNLPRKVERVGFTGTRKEITWKQGLALAQLLSDSNAHELHHGDCEGADAVAAQVAHTLRWTVIAHPPEETGRRAFTYFDVSLPPKPFLQRNHDIVMGTDVLVACPRTNKEQQRSGTWATIRYARLLDRLVFIIWPSGVIERDN